MKKTLFYSFAACGLLGLASCASNEPFAPQGDGATFRLCLPADMAARGSFGDGTDNGDRAVLNNLQYTVYEVTGEGETQTKTPLFDKQVTAFADSQTEETVQIPLAKGKSYQVVFYADDSSNTFASYNGTTGTLSVEYDNAKSNTAGEDAFIGKSIVFKVEGAYSETITLSRPFAQLNWGTDDLDADVLKEILPGLTAEVTVSSGLYSQMDVLTGTVSNEVSGDTTFGEVAYDATNKYFVPQTFPVVDENKDYSLIAMNYLLTGEGTIDCELSFSDTDLVPVTVSGANVMPNYRTNIYGSLLTAPGTFNILINNDFGGVNNIEAGPSVWDGKTVTMPVVNDTDKTVTLDEASDFAGLAQLAKEGNLPAGYTVLITKDMDMDGNTVTPVGTSQRSSNSISDGGLNIVVDGQNHTISNVKIDGSSLTKNDAAAVFAGVAGEGATVKNLNFDNLVINAGNAEQAGVVGLLSDNATVENVNILSGEISGIQGIGLVGRVLKTGTVKNCNNAANMSASTNNIGGIVGAAYYTSNDGKMTISNCHNTGNITAKNVCAGGIVGLSAADITGCTNKGTITGGNNSIGGIAGGITAAGTVSDCINDGNVINTGTSFGTGGIVGWIRYSASRTDYPYTELITVKGCTNNADITGGSSAGGIVGHWYNAGYCENNTNNAKSITATNFAAGIIGTQQIENSTDAASFPDDKLVITGNVSNTPAADITAGLTATIVYINNASRVTISGNTPDQQ